MVKKPDQRTTEQVDPGFLDHEGGGAVRRETASSPDFSHKPENNDVCTPAYNEGENVLADSEEFEESGMALSVTRHASTPPVAEFKFLLCGIDTLDLGLYVVWGLDWKRRLRTLDKKKQEAGKKKGLLVGLPSGRKCIFRPGGKAPNYRFHLQFEAYNLFIAKTAKPGKSPNVYLSISSKTLWLNGIDTALSWITEDLKAIGKGKILFVQVSRVDLCADFWIPGGLSHEFLLSHKATRTDKGNIYLGKDKLETYYVGNVKSPVQLRIYNKGLEVGQGGTKFWFLDLWKRESTEDVWRIEFQIRRPELKRFGINLLDDLKEKRAGLWRHLTMKWFSLRLEDNKKTDRKTIHPLWCSVQDCFNQGNSDNELQPLPKSVVDVSPEWHLSHIDGCLSSFAARLGITNREDALLELQNLLNRRNNTKDFEDACIKKAIQKGTLSDGGDR